MDYSHLKHAEELNSQGDHAGALGELAAAVTEIAKESKDFILSVAPTEMEKLVLSAIRRVGEAAGIIPDLTQYAKIILPELANIIPSSIADFHLDDLKSFLVGLFRKAEEEAEENPEYYQEENPEEVENFKNLLKRLEQEIALRNMIFSPDGAYQSFCSVASPVVSAGLMHLKDTEPNEAMKKAEDILQGPGKNLAVLCYSFMTSEFLAGLVLIFIRRKIPIPFIRKTGIGTKIDLVKFIVPNIPLIIAGLTLVADELKSIKSILATKDRTPLLPFEEPQNEEKEDFPKDGFTIPIQ